MSPAPTTRRRTKIVATIGPASGSREMLRALTQAGMDAARLNFSHGSHDEHAGWASCARQVQDELGKPLGLIAALQGPKFRLEDVTRPRMLTTGTNVHLASQATAREGDLVVAPAAIA